MNFLQKKLSGIDKRIRSLSYGIIYFKNSDFVIPSFFYINGGRRELKFIDKRSDAFVYEFNEICLNDCYQLRDLKKRLSDVKVVVDIGSNQGLFAVAARRHFSKASIFCYEPNSQLANVLLHNSSVLNVKTYFEAVTKEPCKVTLQFGETDLHTKTIESDLGNVTGTSLRTMIERAGGEIDILKMDCEGAEWELFEDTSSWEKIKSVTMEYHLWAKSNFSSVQLFAILNKLGFKVTHHQPISKGFGIVTAVKKSL